MKLTTLACALSLVASPAAAQSPDMAAMMQKFGQSMKANAAALKMYSWKMRVEVTVKGQAQPAKLYAMRYDVDGKIQKTLLTPQTPPPEPGQGMKGRIKARKMEEMKEWAADLGELCTSYLTPSPGVLQTFFAGATPVQAPGGTVQIVGRGVLAPGDRMIYEIDPATGSLKRVMFDASLEGDPVEGSVEFAVVPGGGPSYAARTTVNVPAKQLTAKIENYEYVRQ